MANEYFVGAINRVGIEDLGDDDFYGTVLLRRPRGQARRRRRPTRTRPSCIVRDLDMDLLTEVRNRWAFYRDRRPTPTTTWCEP